jgi:hypothetical protein
MHREIGWFSPDESLIHQPHLARRFCIGKISWRAITARPMRSNGKRFTNDLCRFWAAKSDGYNQPLDHLFLLA